MKSLGIIYTALIGSISIAGVLPYVSATVLVLTGIFTVFKLIDWIEARIAKRKQKEE